MKTKTIIIMFVASFITMFGTMYAMLHSFDHFYLNLNKIYMAGLMTATMGIINPIVMGKMYNSIKLKYTVLTMSTAFLITFYLLIRFQVGINNTPFLRAMIPHHSSAILMCERANVSDPKIKKLCDDIVETQVREIKLMKDMLESKETKK